MKNTKQNWKSLVVLSGFAVIVSQADVFAETNCSADVYGEEQKPDGVVDALDLAFVLNEFDTANPEADINGDGVVDSLDTAEVLAQWGHCPCRENLNGDGEVNGLDVSLLHTAWQQVLDPKNKRKTQFVNEIVTTYDLNNDGDLNALDMAQVLAAFGQQCRAGAPTGSDVGSGEQAETNPGRLEGPFKPESAGR